MYRRAVQCVPNQPVRPSATRACQATREAYTFGRPPATYLMLREIARLMILRSKLRDRVSAAGTPRD